MTEENTPAVEETTEEVDGDINVPQELRAAYKREKAENKKLKAQVMERAYSDAGLDTSVGLGKAIFTLYDGEPDTETILAYAKDEFEWEPPATPENPQQPVIQQQQTMLDNVIVNSAPVDPQTEQEALTKAESEGDYDTAGVIKAERLRRMMQP